MQIKGKYQAWIPFPRPSFTTHVDEMRYLPSLHKVNVPSCRTNLAQSFWTAAHSEIPRLEKAHLAVCHFSEHATSGLDARFMDGILEACGSLITNRIAERETSMALEKINNKRYSWCSGNSTEWRFWQLHLKETRRFNPEGWKRREENEVGTWEIMFYELSEGWAYGLPKIRSNQPSHIHPTQWKMNDMKTCWHVEVYSNSHFGLIAPTTKED